VLVEGKFYWLLEGYFKTVCHLVVVVYISWQALLSTYYCLNNKYSTATNGTEEWS